MSLEMFDLSEKVAIVTGCSTGLGKGMAIGLAAAGADISGVYNSTPPDEIKIKVEEENQEFLGIQADLKNTDSINKIIDKTVDKFGKIDILINNAGIIRREKAIDFTEEDWDDVMNINLKTIFFLSQAVARQFLKQDSRGKIINIASMLSFQGGITVPSYTASKSGLHGLTKALANEWAEMGINVNAIAPGYMATDNTKPLREDKERNNSILSRIPAGRWGKPEDLQGAAIFLASEASNYVHGYTFAVDGGWLAR